MPHIGVDHNFIRGLSDFWQRFFADSDQLEALFDGTAVLMGQAYLDLCANVLNVSLADAPVFNKEYFKLITVREDQVAFEAGLGAALDRWSFLLPDGVVAFASLDNKVIEPTASLQERLDYELTNGSIKFREDPTDPSGAGQPTEGYAHRQIDVAVAGKLMDAATTGFDARSIRKGDVVRLLEVGPTGSPRLQRARQDLPIVLVRQDALYLGGSTSPLPGTVSYVVLRKPAIPTVSFEPLQFISDVAELAETRLVPGTLKIFAKQGEGLDVVESVDYTVDYELGRIHRLTSWRADSTLQASYEWRQEVWPTSTAAPGPPPRFYAGTVTGASTVRVNQLAFWASDTWVDRLVLSNNFGALIGRMGPSSENYRAFLMGIFQLYVLGPVLARIEAAMNVICGLPVIRDDNEVLLDVVTTGPDTNIIRTTRASGGVAEYSFPKQTPLRSDITSMTNWKSLSFRAFEPLTNVVTVTDYVQDPSWWHNIVIPRALFAQTQTADIPDTARRSVTPRHVLHRIGAEDRPRIGDPGLFIGADEYGVIPAAGQPVLRRRFAFVMMDRYFKAHMFFVGFDPSLFSTTNQAARFVRIADDLRDLILSAKPAHTYIYVEPTTSFTDTMAIVDTGYYQPQRYPGANPNIAEVYDSLSSLPSDTAPSVQLGLSVHPSFHFLDRFQFADRPARIGDGFLRIGDWFRYQEIMSPEDFPDTTSWVSLGSAPTAPERARLVAVLVSALKSGRRVVENVDYAVDYVNRRVQRLTIWDSLTTVPITFLQVLMLNETDGSPALTNAQMPVSIGGIDPAIIRADYDSTALDGFDNPWSVADHRDMSMVERPLTILITEA